MFDWLPERIAAVAATPAAQERGWTFVLHPPVGEEALARCETTLGTQLPLSYRTFLSRWDGASLFRRQLRLPDGRVEAGTSLEIAGTGRLPELNAQLQAEVPGDWGQLVVCADTPLGSACHCALNPDVTAGGEYAMVDCDADYGPRCWRRAVIAPSFEAWLVQIFEAALRSGAPYYWLAMPELQALYRECTEEDQRSPSPVVREPAGPPLMGQVSGAPRHVVLRREDGPDK